MGKIVGIGGGDMAALETLELERRVVELSGKEQPRALFIPTASSDSVERWNVFKSIYRARLGCQTEVLYLLNRNPSQHELQDRLLSADVIYVGGGNTLKMMRRWRRLGVDGLLTAAYERGTVLAGRSAGMICWFKYGHSDSMSFYRGAGWSYVRVRGLGLIDGFACPHYNVPPDTSVRGGRSRAEDFQRMAAKYPETGIALDNHCAIEIVDAGYRVITSRPGVGAYKIAKGAGIQMVERLEPSAGYTPVATLLGRP